MIERICVLTRQSTPFSVSKRLSKRMGNARHDESSTSESHLSTNKSSEEGDGSAVIIKELGDGFSSPLSLKQIVISGLYNDDQNAHLNQGRKFPKHNFNVTSQVGGCEQVGIYTFSTSQWDTAMRFPKDDGNSRRIRKSSTKGLIITAGDQRLSQHSASEEAVESAKKISTIIQDTVLRTPSLICTLIFNHSAHHPFSPFLLRCLINCYSDLINFQLSITSANLPFV